MQTVDLAISGMSCGHCVRAVRDALADLPGVTVEQVEIGSATVSHDPAVVPLDEMTRAIEDAGYVAEATTR